MKESQIPFSIHTGNLKRMILIVPLFLFGFIQGDSHYFAFEKLDLEQAMVKAEKEGKNIFVEVMASWCGQCKKLEKEVLTNPRLDSLYHARFVNLQINGEEGEDGRLCTIRYKVTAFPTLLYLSPEGKLLGKYVGVRTVSQMMDYEQIHGRN